MFGHFGHEFRSKVGVQQHKATKQPRSGESTSNSKHKSQTSSITPGQSGKVLPTRKSGVGSKLHHKRKRKRRMTKSRVGFEENLFFIDSGASDNIVFSEAILEDMRKLSSPKNFNCGSGDMGTSEMGSLSKALQHLPLPRDGYYFDKGVVANLLSLAKWMNSGL